MKTPKKTVKIEVLRSQWAPKTFALAVNSTRVAGAKAGPWITVHEFNVDVNKLQEALDEHV